MKNQKSKPIVYLLCGLPGSGKTTYADKLVAQEGVVKLSIDDELISSYGVMGKDYQPEKHREYKVIVLNKLKQRIVESIRRGDSLVLDFGVWKQKDRELFRRIVEESDGICRLIYFKADKTLLLKRLLFRNEMENGSKNAVDEDRLVDIIGKFEEPNNEDEMIVEQTS
ncbi:hypothetical protein BH23PAT2_BH23PAT2_04130 [soil metagenome]